MSSNHARETLLEARRPNAAGAPATAVGLELVDLTRPRTAAYLALNPTGRTPTLIDGDFILWESNAIMQYLASRSGNSLWPENPRTRADITRWQSWQLAHWGADACQPLTFQRLVKKILNLGPPDAAVVAKATEVFNREARMLDAHLASPSYLVGNALTLADIAIASNLINFQYLGFPIEPGKHPKLARYARDIAALDVFRTTLANERPFAEQMGRDRSLLS